MDGLFDALAFRLLEDLGSPRGWCGPHDAGRLGIAGGIKMPVCHSELVIVGRALKVHSTHPYNRVSITSAFFSRRAFRLGQAVVTMAEIMNWSKNAMLEVRFASLASQLFDLEQKVSCAQHF